MRCVKGFVLAGLCVAASLFGAGRARAESTTPIADGSRYVCVHLDSGGTALGVLQNGSIARGDFTQEMRRLRRNIRQYKRKLRTGAIRTKQLAAAQVRYEQWDALLTGMAACQSAAPAAPAIRACSAFEQQTAGLYERIINGTSCDEGKSSVVMVQSRNVYGQPLLNCSGTVITPQVVLTAAHCFNRRSTGEPAVSATVVVDGVTVRSNTVHVHPGFNYDAARMEHNDLAIVILARPLAAPVMPLLQQNDFIIGEQAAIAGYGLTEKQSIGGLRAAFMPLSAVTEEGLTLFYRGSGGNSCLGDSGGPLAVRRNGTWVLAGVTSNGENESCGNDGRNDVSNWANVTSPSNREFIAKYAPSAVW